MPPDVTNSIPNIYAEKETHNGQRPSSSVSNESGQKNITTSAQQPDHAQKEVDEVRTEQPNGSGFLERVLSRTVSRVSVDPGPPPDGGLAAWMQAMMGHLIVFNTWGYVISFGVFQTYYVTALGHPPSDISWVGSVQIFLLFFVGTFSGRATDYGLFRPTFIVGSFFQLLGVFMTSLSTKYWQLFLAQGVCTGLGNGLIFCPALAILSTYFSKKRALAIGIAASGSATGGVVFPAIVERLLPRIGFPWTVRVLGFVMLFVQAITLTFTKPRLPPRKAGPLVEWGAFKETTYTLFAIGMFLIFWGIYFAFYYLGSFGRDIIGISESDSINNLLILNGLGFFGRLVPAVLADRYFGPLNILIPVSFVSGLMLYCWAAIKSKGGLVAFAVVNGIFAAGIQVRHLSLFHSSVSKSPKAVERNLESYHSKFLSRYWICVF